jgi:hypothetical protein
MAEDIGIACPLNPSGNNHTPQIATSTIEMAESDITAYQLIMDEIRHRMTSIIYNIGLGEC